MKQEQITVDVVANTKQFDASMQALTDSTKSFGRIFTSTISNSVKSGKGLDDMLKNLGKRLADLALKQSLKPLENILAGLVNTLSTGLIGGTSGSLTGFSSGGAFTSNGVVPFARGGVISSPALFKFGNRMGLMGESGPEAIMPLKRGSDGRLGVATTPSGNSGTNVVFNVQASDAESFRNTEAQLSVMLARMVLRGRRGL